MRDAHIKLPSKNLAITTRDSQCTEVPIQSFELHGKQPLVDRSAYVAPTATLIGDVRVGPGSAILFGAVLAAESGPISLGRECVIMENAVLRSVARQPLALADHVLIGPHAHLSGCRIESEVFVATGASVFNGAILEEGSVVKINGVVHIRSRLPAKAVVPINWIAIGDPAEILPPGAEERVSSLLAEADFSGTVFGLRRRDIRLMTERYTEALGRYRDLRRTESD